MLDTMLLTPSSDKIDSNAETPKEFEIYCRTESQFLPEGKTFEDLTQQEVEELRNKYRFDFMKTGQYQSISGYGNSF